MSISNGWITGANRISLKHSGVAYQPTAIILHYTVTDNLRGAVSALNSRKLAYHVLIEHDGTVNQTRPLTTHAAHCGYSNWKARSGLTNGSSLNRSSVSVTFINRGFFGRFSGESYYDTNAHGDPVGALYPADTAEATTSIYHPTKRRYWHKFTPQQLATGRRVIGDITAAYPGITEIAGHDDVSIDAKFDTGPLFPIDQVRADTGRQGSLGFRTKVSSPDGTLTLRQRPTASSTALRTLQNGDTVHVRTVAYTTRIQKAIWVDRQRYRYLTKWASVNVDGSNRHSGFVHMKYLAATPLDTALAQRL